MRKNMCKWQQVMLATNLNAYVYSCSNGECEFAHSALHSGRCESCPDREPGVDVAVESIKDSIRPSFEVRTHEEVASILTKHCKKCEDYQADSGLCSRISCSYHIPIESLMMNPVIHCIKGVW